MSTSSGSSMIRWWALAVAGAAAALLFAWLGRLAGVPVAVPLTVAAVLAALAWLAVLVTVPWNLCFAARRAVAGMAASRERGIAVPAGEEAEASRIARRMLGFALGGHLGTAAVTAVIAFLSGARLGYYLAGCYLLTTAVRPTAAYFAHLRQRITTLARESTHPRDDVVSLKASVSDLAGTVKGVQAQLGQAQRETADDLRRLAGDLAHLRQQVTVDLARLADAQAADGGAARSREEELGRRIGQIARQVDATLDGISDHQELLAGLRALVRMIRSEPA